jgi:hypothetical protein
MRFIVSMIDYHMSGWSWWEAYKKARKVMKERKNRI